VTHRLLSCWKRALSPAKDESRLTESRYEDKASIDAHGNSEHFKALGKAMKEEDLLAGPMKVMVTKEAGGFASRL